MEIQTSPGMSLAMEVTAGAEMLVTTKMKIPALMTILEAAQAMVRVTRRTVKAIQGMTVLMAEILGATQKVMTEVSLAL